MGGLVLGKSIQLLLLCVWCFFLSREHATREEQLSLTVNPPLPLPSKITVSRERVHTPPRPPTTLLPRRRHDPRRRRTRRRRRRRRRRRVRRRRRSRRRSPVVRVVVVAVVVREGWEVV